MHPYAMTEDAVKEAEDRVLRCLVFSPLTFPFSAPALLFRAGLHICSAALLDTALLPAGLQKSRQSTRAIP